MAKAQEKGQAKAIEAAERDHQIVEAASSQTYDMPASFVSKLDTFSN
jgi:hypothetical protein